MSNATYKCPMCHGEMVHKTRKYDGKQFYGCSRYPRCKGTREADGRTPEEIPTTVEVTERKCPDCGAPLVARSGYSKRARKAYAFLGCSRYPVCRHTEDAASVAASSPAVVEVVKVSSVVRYIESTQPDVASVEIVEEDSLPAVSPVPQPAVKVSYFALPAHQPTPRPVVLPQVEEQRPVRQSVEIPRVDPDTTSARQVTEPVPVQPVNDRQPRAQVAGWRFHAAVKVLAKLASRNRTMGLIAGIRLYQDRQGALCAQATDLDSHLTWNSQDSSVTGQGLDVVVSGRELLAAATPTAGRDTWFELTQTADGKLTVCNGQSTRTLPTLGEVTEWPCFPDVPSMGATVKLGTTERAQLAWVNQAASTDDTRPNLCGVYVGNKVATGECEVVATDGHRLHKALVPNLYRLNEGQLNELGLPHQRPSIIIKESAVDLLLALPGEWWAGNVQDQDHVLTLEGNGWEFSTRLIEAFFPDFDRVIPKGKDLVVDFDGAALLAALKGLPKTKNSATGIKLKLNGNVEVFQHDADNGDYQTTLPYLWKDGPDATVGLNPILLRQALTTGEKKKMEVRAWFGCGDGSKIDLAPTIWHTSMGQAVVMPMAL